jgi:alpha-glucosidase (family GH31 glycosyl hydrolase)
MAHKIPLDVMWNDIDWMYKKLDFVSDPVRYAGIGEYVDDLHKLGKKYVPILDCGIG